MPEFLVTASDSGERLDRFLARQLPAHSRAYLQHLIDREQILVGGQVTKPGHRLRAGDHITVVLPPPQPAGVLPEPIPLDILYEDVHLLIVNKPAGMVVHPSPGNPSGTLVNALLAHCTTLSGIGGVERPGIVHRLDKDTSGAMAVAKDDLTHRELARQFAERRVKKLYLAIVRGDIRGEEGIIDAAVGRHPVHRQKMSTHTRAGRTAVTEFRVVERFGGYTLVELHPRTGRTHQIRVHMAALGHPLLGDPTYGRSRQGLARSALAAKLAWFQRQALHAWVLGIQHPHTGERLERCAPLPADMERLLDILRCEQRSGGESLKKDDAMTDESALPQASILALVNDLFFALKIQDTAKHLGLPIAVAGSSAEFFDRLTGLQPALVIADLTMGGVDMAALLEQYSADPRRAAVPVLGYTTHADWKRTSPLHDKCAKVVTKDTLSRSLPALIQQLLHGR
jgi:23S rRNA pseudouridine1911/1915/1917 synthase